MCLITGKREKYTNEERIANAVEEARRRDEHEKKNTGNYTKIFLLGEEQLKEYRKYYDYATELYNAAPRTDNAMGRGSKEAPAYLNYFRDGRGSEGRKRREEKENNLKNNSRMMREGENRPKANQTQTSFLSQNKRVSSAKNRREKKEKRVVY